MNVFETISRQNKAELSSSAGAGLLGAGLGALLIAFLRPEIARPLAVACIVLGIMLHGWGMLERRRLEAGIALPWWSKALYWLCWTTLGILVAWIGMTAWNELR